MWTEFFFYCIDSKHVLIMHGWSKYQNLWIHFYTRAHTHTHTTESLKAGEYCIFRSPSEAFHGNTLSCKSFQHGFHFHIRLQWEELTNQCLLALQSFCHLQHLTCVWIQKAKWRRPFFHSHLHFSILLFNHSWLDLSEGCGHSHPHSLQHSSQSAELQMHWWAACGCRIWL